jgi:hypothetical protein
VFKKPRFPPPQKLSDNQKLLPLLFFLLLHTGLAQVRIRNLYFNSTQNILRLNFDTQPPTPFYTNTGSGASIGEGIAHTEDTDGNIIAWVNASGVYDKNGTLMPGSAGMLANPSSTEMEICPFPADPKKYYVFYNRQLCSSLNYAIVDMTQRGGLGDVVSKNNVVEPGTNFAEGMEIIRIPCSNNFWLMTYQCYTGLKRFRIDASGISAGVLVQNFDADNHQGRGELDYFKGRIGYAVTYRNRAFVGDFDPVSGNISHGKNLTFAATNGMYGLEFSPDASKVYFTDWDNRDILGNIASPNLFRYDFASGNIRSFNIAYDNAACPTANVEGLGQIELGKDGKLYIPHVSGCQISVVETPNEENPVFSKINVSTILSTGVSDHIQSDFLEPLQITASKTSTCSGESVTLTATGGTGNLSWKPAAGIANPTNRTIQVNPAVSTTYVFSADNQFGCRDSVRIHIGVGASPVLALNQEVTVCANQKVKLDAGNAGKGFTYQWSDGSTGQILETDKTGDYTVKVGSPTCFVTTTFKVSVAEVPVIAWGGDTTVCGNEPLRLDAGNSGKGFTYQWSDGSTGQTLDVRQTGEYSVVVSNKNCLATAKIKVRFLNSDSLQVYNVITPDRVDDKNDCFEIKGFAGEINVAVYNRWGKQVFRKEKYRNDWNAEGLPAGAYFYRITHLNNCFPPVNGWLHVLR